MSLYWYHSFAQSPNPSIYLSKLVNLVPCCDTFLYLCSRICSFWWNLSECFYSVLSYQNMFFFLVYQPKVCWYDIFQNILILIYLPENWCDISTKIFVFWYIYQNICVLVYQPDYLCSDMYLPDYWYPDISTRLFVFWYIYQIFVFWYIYRIICILVYQNICILMYLPEYLYSDIFTRIFVFWYIYQNICTLIYLPERMDGLITW